MVGATVRGGALGEGASARRGPRRYEGPLAESELGCSGEGAERGDGERAVDAPGGAQGPTRTRAPIGQVVSLLPRLGGL